MARTSSIFYLAQQNKLGHSTALPVSLNALITPSTSISRFHRERLERVKNDVQAAEDVKEAQRVHDNKRRKIED